MILHRLNFDFISLMFSEGSLSTAYLNILGSQYDVSSFLPGLKERDAVNYLKPFGFFVDIPVVAKDHPIADVLSYNGVFPIIIVRASGDVIELLVAPMPERTFPTPKASGIVCFSVESNLILTK